MNEMRELMNTLKQLEESSLDISAKQVYEWVKTGHWSRRQFDEWVTNIKRDARKSSGRTISQMKRSGTL